MAKRKRTKKQKVISDLRRQLHTVQPTVTETSPTRQDATPTQESRGISYSFSKQQAISGAAPRRNSFDQLVTYLPHDLRKTATVTLAIITAEIILFFVTRNTM